MARELAEIRIFDLFCHVWSFHTVQSVFSPGSLSIYRNIYIYIYISVYIFYIYIYI